MLTGPEHLPAVVVAASAAVLLWAGVPKLRRRRLIGVVETAAGLWTLLGPDTLCAAAPAALFAGFCVVHLAGREDCDCFVHDAPTSSVRAAVLTGVIAAALAGAAAEGAPSLFGLAGLDPRSLVWTPAAGLLLALAWRVAFSGPDVLRRLVDRTSAVLAGQRLSEPGGALEASRELPVGLERRGFLLRVAVVGSALATAPLRYLLYPGTALAAVVRPWECGSGLCTDGYTAFCCEITDGATNTCPTGTFPGGWWMCTDYAGRRLCSEQGVRYYVDCNALPGRTFPGGCHCADGDCDHRRVACNIFRYGQCNTQIDGTTAVVCRMVVCENPAHISELNCSASLAVDNAVCGHDVPCLEPPALQLSGAGGA